MQQARRGLEEGAAEYAALAASDFSVAVSQQVEHKRLAALAGEVEKRTSDALAQVQVQKAKAREARAAHALAARRVVPHQFIVHKDLPEEAHRRLF